MADIIEMTASQMLSDYGREVALKVASRWMSFLGAGNKDFSFWQDVRNFIAHVEISMRAEYVEEYSKRGTL